MTVKIEVAPRTTIKAKAATRIVGQVTAGNGIAVTNSAGNFRVALDSDVVQSVVDDENVTGDITSGVLTLGWTGILDTDRGGAGTGTSGYALIANGTGVQSTYQGFLQSGTGAVTQTWQDALRSVGVNATQFGAVAGSAAAAVANTAAINAALLAHKVVRLTGHFHVSGTITLPSSGSYLIGDGPNASGLIATTASTPLLQPAGGITDYGAIGLTLDRTPAATSGGYGIYQPSTNDGGHFEFLRVKNHYHNIYLGATGYSRIAHVIVHDSVSHGVVINSLDTAGTFQWNIFDLAVASSGGDGINVSALLTTAGCTMGNWNSVSSFGNAGAAARFTGDSSHPVNGIRISDSFFGQDGDHELVFANTFARDHYIANTYIELGAATGIVISGTTNGLRLNNVVINGMTNYGIFSEADSLVITGSSKISNNGAGGINIDGAGKLVLSDSLVHGNTGSGLTLGAFAIDANITGNQFYDNTVSNLSNASTGSVILRGNLGLNDRYPNGSFIGDANGNELVIFATTASAVNEFTIANAATGFTPTLSATGGDAAINLGFQVKGAATYNFFATASGPTGLRLFEATGAGSNSIIVTVPGAIGSDKILTLPDATDTLVGRDTTDTLTNKSMSGASNTFTNIPLATAVTGDLAFANLTQGSGLSVLGVTGNATADHASIAAGSDHQVLRRSGTALTFGAVNLAQTAAVTGTLPVGNGGSGAATFTANAILLGNGTSAFGTVAAGASGTVLTGTGGAPAYSASPTLTSLGLGGIAPGTPLDLQSNASAQAFRVRGRAADDISAVSFTNNAVTQTQGGIVSSSAGLELDGGTTPSLICDRTTGAVTNPTSFSSSGGVRAFSGTAIPAGGTAGSGLTVSSTSNFGVFFGSGAPTLSAAKGSLYLRSDGSATNNRAYINTDGGTTWTALTTAA